MPAFAGVARNWVRRRCYSLRARRLSGDEVGILTSSFNDMLAEIRRLASEVERSQQLVAQAVDERDRGQQAILRLEDDFHLRIEERTAQLVLMHEELISTRSDGDNANRAKWALLWGMHHELHTPFNAMLGFGKILASGSPPTTVEQKQEFMNHIVDAGERLKVLVDEVLDLARVESGV